jgi:hypothetical protein
MPGRAARALLPVFLHVLAREIDRATGVLLHTTLDLPGFVSQALALVDWPHALGRAIAWTGTACLLWAALAHRRARVEGVPLHRAAEDEARALFPLLLRPALTLIALFALAVMPTYPYGFTFAVALTQDWGIGQDLLALAALVAGHLSLVPPRLARVPVPGAGGVAFLAFLTYALLTPDWARQWEGHPGNEPKTLRMAVAIGHDLTLDVEGVSAGMEALPVRPLREAVSRAAATVAGEGLHMLGALAAGPSAVGRDAIRATRVTRQTIRGKDGGVFHVLAPGTSLVLAPALRADRALNRAHGTPGRLGVTVVFWNLLAALAVAAVFTFARDATGRPGLAAVVAFAAGLLPPYVFYAYQFYPEMLGALALAVALRAIVLTRFARGRPLLGLGLLLGFLPWLHQKFLPVWLLLAAMALVKAVGELVPLRSFLALLLPSAVSLFLFALYNFAITGSVRPDAVFLAWGPGGVSSSRLGQGLLGLLLDARYGLLPYVPAYLLAAGGLVLAVRARSPLLRALPAVAVYYLTVASADNWSGAVCNLGRYIQPATPYLAALAALALAATASRSAPRLLALVLAALSAVIGVALVRDPHAANDCAVLLARADFADGNLYVPNLFLRTWADAAPGLWARVAAWTVTIAAVAAVYARARRRDALSATRALAGTAVLLCALAFALERWPPSRTAARFDDALEVEPGLVAFVGAPVDDGGARVGPGTVRLLVRARAETGVLRLRVHGAGGVRPEGGAPVPITPRGIAVDVPLRTLKRLEGRRGVVEFLAEGELRVQSEGAVRLSAP